MDGFCVLSLPVSGVQSRPYNTPLYSYVTWHQKIEDDFASTLAKIRSLLERLPGLESRFQLLNQLLGRVSEITPEIAEEWQALLRRMGKLASERCQLNLARLNAYVMHEFPTWQKGIEGTSKRANFVAMCQAFMNGEALRHRRTFADLREAEARVKQEFERLEGIRAKIEGQIGSKKTLFQSPRKIESLEVPLSVSPHPQKDEFEAMVQTWKEGQKALAQMQERFYELQQWLVAASEKRASADSYTKGGLGVQLGAMGPATALKDHIERCQKLLTSQQEAARHQTLQRWGKADGESKRWGDAVAFELKARMEVMRSQLELISAVYDSAFKQAESEYKSLHQSDRSATSSPSLGSSVLGFSLSARVKPLGWGDTLRSWIGISPFKASQKSSPSINWEGFPKIEFPNLYRFDWASEEAWAAARPTAPVTVPAEKKDWSVIHYWADLVGDKRDQVFRDPDDSLLTQAFILNLQGHMVVALNKRREPALQSAVDRFVLQHKKNCETFNPPPSTPGQLSLTMTLVALKDTLETTPQTLDAKRPQDSQILTKELLPMSAAYVKLRFWNALWGSTKALTAAALDTKAKAAILSPSQVSDIVLEQVSEEPPLNHFSDVLRLLRLKGDNALDTPESLREFQALSEALEKQKLSRFDCSFLAESQKLDHLIEETTLLAAHIEKWQALAEIACSLCRGQPFHASDDRDFHYERLATSHLRFTTHMLKAIPFLSEAQAYCKSEAEKLERKRTQEKQNWRQAQIEWFMHTESGVRKRASQIDRAFARYRLADYQLQFLIDEMRVKYNAGFANMQELFLFNGGPKSRPFAEHFFDVSLPDWRSIQAATVARPVNPHPVISNEPKDNGGADPAAEFVFVPHVPQEP